MPLLLCAGVSAALLASPAAAQFRVVAAPPVDSAPQVQLTVRQNGGGEEDGLLKQMRGPAALWGFAEDGGRVSALAGTMQAGAGERRYLALRDELPLAGGKARFTYTSDDRDGAAAEARFSHALGPVDLNFSQTINRGFESAWTGQGAGEAAQITDGSVSGALGGVLAGLGLRETLRRGGRATELHTYQMVKLDSLTLMHVAATVLTAPGAPRTSGSVMAMGQFRTVSYVAELDYGGARSWQPSAARLSVDMPLGRSWDFYAEADQPLPRGAGTIDIGASLSLGGFEFGPFAALGRGGTMLGIRLWLPLYPAERAHAWLGPYYDGRRMNARR